jgi:prefoldin subunit 5
MDDMLTAWIAQAEELQRILNDTIPDMETDINELFALVTAINASISDMQQIRDQIAGLTEMDKDLQRQIDSINTNWDEIDNRFNSVNARIDSIKYVVGAEFLAELWKVQGEFYTMKYELQSEMREIKKRLDAIDTSVYNPWAGRRVDQDENDKLIYADLADMVPTATEYASLGLSASDYAAYDLSAYEYAVRGKKHLKMFYVFSPVYGFKQAISNVLTSIVNYIAGTMTAAEYAALDLDADEYSNLDLTSIEYMEYNENGSGLTASDYAAIIKLNSGFLKI